MLTARDALSCVSKTTTNKRNLCTLEQLRVIWNSIGLVCMKSDRYNNIKIKVSNYCSLTRVEKPPSLLQFLLRRVILESTKTIIKGSISSLELTTGLDVSPLLSHHDQAIVQGNVYQQLSVGGLHLEKLQRESRGIRRSR